MGLVILAWLDCERSGYCGKQKGYPKKSGERRKDKEYEFGGTDVVQMCMNILVFALDKFSSDKIKSRIWSMKFKKKKQWKIQS